MVSRTYRPFLSIIAFSVKTHLIGKLSRDELAVAIAYRSQLRSLAGKIRALETRGRAFSKSACSDLTHLIFLGQATLNTIGTFASHHARANLASNAAHSDLHERSLNQMT